MDPLVAERRLRAITRHLSPLFDDLASSHISTNPTAGEFVNGTCFFKWVCWEKLVEIPFIWFFEVNSMGTIWFLHEIDADSF